jgi:hypothetical protein
MHWCGFLGGCLKLKGRAGGGGRVGAEVSRNGASVSVLISCSQPQCRGVETWNRVVFLRLPQLCCRPVQSLIFSTINFGISRTSPLRVLELHGLRSLSVTFLLSFLHFNVVLPRRIPSLSFARISSGAVRYVFVFILLFNH